MGVRDAWLALISFDERLSFLAPVPPPISDCTKPPLPVSAAVSAPALPPSASLTGTRRLANAMCSLTRPCCVNLMAAHAAEERGEGE